MQISDGFLAILYLVYRLEKNARAEMEHMEYLSEKIVAYDGEPTT